MVQQRGEPLLPVAPCCLTPTCQTLGHTLPVLCRWRVSLTGVFLGSRPSLHQLRRFGLLLRCFVRWFHRYYGAIRLLTATHAGLVANAFSGRTAFVACSQR